MTLDDLTKYLAENHQEKEKLDAIREFQYSGYMLKEDDIKKTIELLPKMDKNIIDPFLQLILYLNHLINGKEIRISDEISNKILDKFIYDPARFMRIFSFFRFHFKPQEDFFESYHIELEKFLKKSDALLSYYLDNNPNDLMQTFRQVPDYSLIYRKMRDGDDLLKKIASSILEQCKKAKVFEQSFSDEQAKNIFNSSLQVLTGKDCSNDYDVWKKAISTMP